MLNKYWRVLSQNELSSSCLFEFFIVFIFQASHLIDMYSLSMTHSSAVGVCLPPESRSVALLDQGTLMDGRAQRVSTHLSLGFD